MIRGLFFDIGNTLAGDPRQIAWASLSRDGFRGTMTDGDASRFVEALRIADGAIDRDDYSHFLGEPAFLVAACRSLPDIPTQSVRRLLRAYRDAVLSAYELNPALRPAHGKQLMRLLDSLHAKGVSAIGIVSNERRWAPRVYLEHVLDVDFALFDPVITSGELGFGKPDPRVFKEALRRTGLRASEAAYVGDSPERDMAPAIGLGMVGFWFRALLPRPDDKPPPGSIPIDDLTELPALLSACD